MSMTHAVKSLVAILIIPLASCASPNGRSGSHVQQPGSMKAVLGGEGAAIPLTISSDAPASVHQLETQTLTFTFGEAVAGFDDSDVSLSGGTAGTFEVVSAEVYTLEVTGSGGTVTASVAAGAALSESGTGKGNAASSYSNFYQDTWTLDLDGGTTFMEFIRIPAGTFTMGSPAGPDPPAELSRLPDETEHEVTISRDFYLGKTEVTQAQWLAVFGTFPSGGQDHGMGVGHENRAVHLVSHNDITDASTGYMKLLNDHITATMQGPAVVTLPTESQWEYACRAGTTTRFNFGEGFGADEFCSEEAGRTDNMWYCGNNSPVGTKLVGQKPANAWGMSDMHGNVWEWCGDWYGPYPGTVTDPPGPVFGSSRVFRGGGWNYNALFCRSAQRHTNMPNGRNNFTGFRVLADR